MASHRMTRRQAPQRRPHRFADGADLVRTARPETATRAVIGPRCDDRGDASTGAQHAVCPNLRDRSQQRLSVGMVGPLQHIGRAAGLS